MLQGGVKKLLCYLFKIFSDIQETFMRDLQTLIFYKEVLVTMELLPKEELTNP